MGKDIERPPEEASTRTGGPSDPRAGPAPAARASIGETVRAVAWSFLGVRRRDAHERDAMRLHPVAVIVVGIALAALFVVTLLLIVRAVVG